MLQEITAKQFVEWEAYARMEPFNELRADARSAQVAHMIYNMAVDAKHRKPFEDFLLKFDGENKVKEQVKPKQTWQEQQKIMQLWAAAFSQLEAEK